MSDLAALRAAIEAARARTFEVGGMQFDVLLPSDADALRLLERQQAAGTITTLSGAVEMVRPALRGWRQVTQADLAEGAPADPLPFTEEAIGLLIEHRPGVWLNLHAEMLAEVRARRERIEAARKN